jgi:hypothetical protein
MHLAKHACFMPLVPSIFDKAKTVQDTSKKRYSRDKNVNRYIGIVPPGEKNVEAADVKFSHQFCYVDTDTLCRSAPCLRMKARSTCRCHFFVRV